MQNKDIERDLERANEEVEKAIKSAYAVMSFVDPSVKKEIQAVIDSFRSNSNSSEAAIKDILERAKTKLEDVTRNQ